MSEHVGATFAKVAELHGRVLEIGRRLQQDVQLLAAAQRELSEEFGRLRLAWPEVPAPAPPRPTGPMILRAPEVSKRIGLGRSSLWRLTKDGQFPAPRRLSGRAVGWLEADVTEWIERRDDRLAPPAPLPSRRRR